MKDWLFLQAHHLLQIRRRVVPNQGCKAFEALRLQREVLCM